MNSESRTPRDDFNTQADSGSRPGMPHPAFFTTMHYELRTPLNTIIGYTEILIEDAEDLGETDLLPDLEKILAAGKSLLAAVDRTLDPSIFASRSDHPNLESVASFIRHELLNPLNAVIGYTELLLDEAEDRDQKALIPDLQKVRAAAENQQALINSIITLSRAEQPPTPSGAFRVFTSPETATAAVPDDRASILLADDNTLNRQLLARFLESQGYQVSTAGNGREALDLIKSETFDLILLDLLMPEVNGVQVLEEVKNRSDLRHIPVIMISALNQIDQIAACIELGAEDYLPLPLNRVLLTARINACLEKKRLRDLDAKRLDELAATVEKLRISEEKALAANQAKSAFLAGMSHELRTPLNAIIGFSQLMARDDRLSAAHRDNVGSILRSGEHLLGLINDVLSISKIEAGKTTLNPVVFDFRALLKGIEDMFRLPAETKGIQWILDTSSNLAQFVSGDEGKLRQVLINLVGNAFKFTEQGGVALRTRMEASHVFLEIEDTGCGIAAWEIDRLFEPFHQTESGRKARGGTGLGLAISRNFIRLMGGDISVRSELGKGTLFSFDIELPVVSETEHRIQAQPKAIGLAPGQPGFRILIADDHPENRVLMGKLFESLGLPFIEAETGEEAVRMWREHRPDLIWMDLHMPGLDGCEATRLIRETEEEEKRKQEQGKRKASENSSRDCVIIALSASAFERDRKRIAEVGCDDFVSKPYRIETILEKLTEHLGVEYLHESETPPPVRAELTAERFSAQPAERLDLLRRMLFEGNLEAARKVAEDVRESDPALADELDEYLKTYRIDDLLDALTEPE